MKNGKKLLVLSALFLVACGGGGQSNSTPGSSETGSVENTSVSEGYSSDAPTSEATSELTSDAPTSEATSDAPTSESQSSSEDPIVKYAILDVINVSNGYVADDEILGLAKGQEFEPGEAISASIQTTYEDLDDAQVARYLLQVNDTIYQPSKGEVNELGLVLNYSIVAPSEDATVFIIVNNLPQSVDNGYSITLVDSPFAKILGYDVNGKYSGQLNLRLYWDPGFAPEKLEYRAVGSEEWIDTDTYFYSNSILIYFDLSSVGADVEFRLTGNYIGLYNITYINADKVGVDSYSPLPKVAQPGANVNFNIYSSDDYYSYEAPTITGVDAESLTATASRVSFTMPENDVVVEFKMKEKPTITFAEDDGFTSAYTMDGSNPSYSSEITKAEPGDNVYAFITAASGKAIEGIKVNDGELISGTTSNSGDVYYQFKMPDDGSDAVITVVTADAINIAIEYAPDSVGGTISATSTAYAPGSEVRINVKAEDSFHGLESIYVKDHEEIELEYHESYSGDYYTFTMPDFEITLVAKFKALAVSNIEFALSDDSNLDYFSLGGQDSGVWVSPEDAEAGKLLQGEGLNVSISTKNKSSTPSKFVFKDGSGNTISSYDYQVDQWGYGGFDGVVVPTGYDTLYIDVEFDYNTPLKYKVEDNGLTGYKLTYKGDGAGYYDAPTEDLGQVYPGSQITINIEGDAGEGFEFAFVVKYEDGTVVNPSYGTYKVEQDFTIEVKKVGKVTMTLEGAEELGITGQFMDPNYEYIFSGSSISSGTIISAYFYASEEFTIEVIAGGEVIYSADAIYEWGDYAADVSIAVPDTDFTVKFTKSESSGSGDSSVSVDGLYFNYSNSYVLDMYEGEAFIDETMAFSYEVNEDGSIEYFDWEDPSGTYELEDVILNEDGSITIVLVENFETEVSWTFAPMSN